MAVFCSDRSPAECRSEEPSGPPVDGAGPLQPLHHPHQGGGRGAPPAAAQHLKGGPSAPLAQSFGPTGPTLQLAVAWVGA